MSLGQYHFTMDRNKRPVALRDIHTSFYANWTGNKENELDQICTSSVRLPGAVTPCISPCTMRPTRRRVDIHLSMIVVTSLVADWLNHIQQKNLKKKIRLFSLHIEKEKTHKLSRVRYWKRLTRWDLIKCSFNIPSKREKISLLTMRTG